MTARVKPILALFVPLVLLSACSGDKAPDRLADRDAAVSDALDDPIMADPDLSSQNRGNSALSGGGPATAEVPPDKRTSEEADRARGAAKDLLGGAIEPAPTAKDSLAESALNRAATLEAAATALKLGASHCPARTGYGFVWAARFPSQIPVYPRAHARVAAGTDEAGCRLRLVRFASPVEPQDLIDFYFAAARKAGLSPVHRREGGDDVVSGSAGQNRFAVYVRKGPDGMTEAVLATSGF
ncbi:MAG: hypothetical protein ACKOPG_00705 [Novosphingobium sp.]